MRRLIQDSISKVNSKPRREEGGGGGGGIPQAKAASGNWEIGIGKITSPDQSNVPTCTGLAE